ncbi:PDR/VanB family oxidoreductase [Paenarthrobacter sp. NPDC091669]|uniref:PDR/VanB family oxidoreductase n=1 Tax=Paenarthrobacter sp. NPDC091669 TaxID=3364384 RepID=UPI0038101335
MLSEVATAPKTPLSYQAIVADASLAAEGILTLTLEAKDGVLPRWTPGAHIDFELAPGVVRQYSLCGNPEDVFRWRIAVLRNEAGRGGSRYIHERIRIGQQVGVSEPRNHFSLVDATSHFLVAGGIGITPLLPMVYELEARGSAWQLIYLGRSREKMAFLDELEKYGDRVQAWPSDERGRFPVSQFLTSPSFGARVYCCGPAPLLAAMTEASATWPSASLHAERFQPVLQDTKSPSTEFEVELAKSGEVFTIPKDKSILEVLETSGISVKTSCREGTCGTCEVYLVDGEAEHRDSVLTPEEQVANESLMICCSRAKSRRLVLDI